MRNLLFLVFIVTFCQPITAASLYTVADSIYQQNFDTLANSGSSNTWTNESTINGWFATDTNYAATDGATTVAGGLLSLGATGSTDRALGANGQSGQVQYGFHLQNNTGLSLQSFSISFAGEQWRNSGSTIGNTNTFDWRIDNTPTINTTIGSALPALNYSANFISLGGPLDGNLAANRQLKSATTGFVWNPGEFLTLRWTDTNEGGLDHYLGIDDFTFSASISAVPEPSTIGWCSLIFVVAARRRSKGKRWRAIGKLPRT